MSMQLIDQDWLTTPATLAVMDALEAAGGPGCARFVGGSVRNALRGQAVDDLDIATTLMPEAVMAALKTARVKAVPTGLAHGTVTAVSGGRPYEITTLRRDVQTDGRHAVVAFTDDWAADAARRDFRLNALYADRAGRVFDPTGQGVDDALAGRVVFVGEAERRIAEDYLRILRFFRFFAWYGDGVPDAEGLRACAAMASGLDRLSAERVSKELLKLLAAPDPRPAVEAMQATGVLQKLLPEAERLDLFRQMVDVTDDAALRLSALLPIDGDVVSSVAARLRLSNAVRDRLIKVASVSGSLDAGARDTDVRVAVYRHGKQAVADYLTRLQAIHPGRAPNWQALEQIAQHWPVPRLPVGGHDLARRGIEPGPTTGAILKAFEAGWIADDFPDTGHSARLDAAIAAITGQASPG